VERHRELYTAEHGWDSAFGDLVASIMADYAALHDPSREAGWIAMLDRRRAGCVFCIRSEDEAAKLRVLLVEPWARGRGIGARLVDECVSFARAAGYRRLVLWTVDTLIAARRLYERAGFSLVDETPTHAFGHDMVDQHWSLDL
jgi:GNAT superfamily N-acetyltransferase